MFGRLLSPIFVFGLLVVPSLAQSQDNPPAQNPAPAGSLPAPDPTSAPQKKVWTNDDLPGGKRNGSAATDKRDQNAHATSSQPADAATAARIKQDLEKLQVQLDEVNKKLKSYKEFQDGEAVSSGARDLSKGYSRTPIDQQVAQLLDKKKKLEAQIGDLNDEARKKGIDPGLLR